MKNKPEILSKVTKKDVVFLTLDNINDTASLSQHIFRNRLDGEMGFYGQMYGNITLCNRFRAYNQDEKMDLDLFDHEKQAKSVCKTCLKIYDKLVD